MQSCFTQDSAAQDQEASFPAISIWLIKATCASKTRARKEAAKLFPLFASDPGGPQSELTF